MLGILFILTTALLENLGYKEINNTSSRNLATGLMLLFSSFAMLAVYLLFYGFSSEDFTFFSDYKFFVLIALEVLVVYFFRESYNYHKESYVVVNMFIFSTIFIMPVVTFYYNDFFDFSPKNNIRYGSVMESLLFSGALFLLWLAYFYDKFRLKNDINYRLLFSLLFILLNVMYFSVKTMHTYNGFLIYFFIDIFISILFLLRALKRGEKIEGLDIKRPVEALKYGFFGIAVIMAVLSAMFLAVEFVTIFKRVGQILSGIIIDKRMVKKKDSFAILMIVVVTAAFYLYKF